METHRILENGRMFLTMYVQLTNNVWPWSVLALVVQPEERNLEIIAEAERATITGLLSAARDAGASAMRVLASVSPTLASSPDSLGLAPDESDERWLRCDEG